MIEYIKGTVSELTPTYAVVECAGIGYFVNVSLNTYSALSGACACKLYIHEVIREDAHHLYGFLDCAEREKFRLLVSVSGIGPNTARMILSSLTAEELENAIAAGDTSALKSIKGIGAKTAERAIVDLRDKIGKTAGGVAATKLPDSRGRDEAVAALTMLGFKQQDSTKVVNRIYTEKPATTVEEAIKLALKML